MTRSSLSYFNFLFFALNCGDQKSIYVQTRPQVGKKVQKNYRRLHLPVDALAQNRFSHDVKRLRFWYQTSKFSHPINVKFPRQSFAVITVKNVRQICENPFTDISRAGKASGTQDFFREVGEDLFYMTVNHKRPSWELFGRENFKV